MDAETIEAQNFDTILRADKLLNLVICNITIAYQWPSYKYYIILYNSNQTVVDFIEKLFGINLINLDNDIIDPFKKSKKTVYYSIKIPTIDCIRYYRTKYKNLIVADTSCFNLEVIRQLVLIMPKNIKRGLVSGMMHGKPKPHCCEMKEQIFMHNDYMSDFIKYKYAECTDIIEFLTKENYEKLKEWFNVKELGKYYKLLKRTDLVKYLKARKYDLQRVEDGKERKRLEDGKERKRFHNLENVHRCRF